MFGRVSFTTRKCHNRWRLFAVCLLVSTCLLLLRATYSHVTMTSSNFSSNQRQFQSDIISTSSAAAAKVLYNSSVVTSATVQNQTRYLAFMPSGRLGNQMFIFASAYGIARHLNRTLVSSERLNEVSKYFSVNILHLNVSHWLRVEEKQGCAFDAAIYELENLENEAEICVKGYLQSWQYFAGAFDDIRRLFSFSSAIASKVQIFLADLVVRPKYDANSVVSTTPTNVSIGGVTRSNDTISTNQRSTTTSTVYVGVHIRRSDMMSSVSMEFGFDTGTEGDYIVRAMIHYVTRYDDVIFVVCSDDMQWSKRSFTLPQGFSRLFNIKFCRDFDPPAVHLGILSACNHSIITGGSFGWWSAFLAGGQTVYYRGFPRPGSGLAREFSASKADYYLPGWIGL